MTRTVFCRPFRYLSLLVRQKRARARVHEEQLWETNRGLGQLTNRWSGGGRTSWSRRPAKPTFPKLSDFPPISVRSQFSRTMASICKCNRWPAPAPKAGPKAGPEAGLCKASRLADMIEDRLATAAAGICRCPQLAYPALARLLLPPALFFLSSRAQALRRRCCRDQSRP